MKWEYYNLCRFPWFPYWDTQLNSEKMEAPKIRTIFGCKRGIDMRRFLFQGYIEQNIYHFQASNLDRCKALENHLKTSHFLTHCLLQKAVIVIFVTKKLPNKSEKICESRWNSVKTNQPRFIFCFSNQPSFASKAVKGSDTKVYLTKMYLKCYLENGPWRCIYTPFYNICLKETYYIQYIDNYCFS